MGGEEPANDLLSGANDIDNAFAVDKFSKKGNKSHILLQLQKSYKDDDRFKLNKTFTDIDTTKLPQSMINALSSKEYDDLVRGKGKREKTDEPNAQGPDVEMEADVLDDTANHQWDTEIDLKSEKQKLFTVLSNFVPHSEIYFNHMAAGKLA